MTSKYVFLTGIVYSMLLAATSQAADAVLDMMLFEGMLASFVGKPGTPCANVSIDDARAKLGSEPGTVGSRRRQVRQANLYLWIGCMKGIYQIAIGVELRHVSKNHEGDFLFLIGVCGAAGN